MLMEKIQQILNQLACGNSIKVAFDGSDIMVRFIDDASKISLSTLIYDGGNYIPPSVRRCISHKISLPFTHTLTYLTVDEEKFQVKLNYLGSSEILTDHLKDLLLEFGSIAEKWRVYLDEHDKNDLIYVKI